MSYFKDNPTGGANQEYHPRSALVESRLVSLLFALAQYLLLTQLFLSHFPPLPLDIIYIYLDGQLVRTTLLAASPPAGDTDQTTV